MKCLTFASFSKVSLHTCNFVVVLLVFEAFSREFKGRLPELLKAFFRRLIFWRKIILLEVLFCEGMQESLPQGREGLLYIGVSPDVFMNIFDIGEFSWN